MKTLLRIGTVSLCVVLAGCSALFPFETARDGPDAEVEPTDSGPEDSGAPVDASREDGGPDAGPSERDWTDIALGRSFSCAIRAPGELYCWGSGASGRLGVDDGVDRSAPSPFPITVPVLDVELGANHACAIVDDSGPKVVCWGISERGQAAREGGHTDSPEQLVYAHAPAAQLALGEEHSCLRNTDGEVWCWGNNRHGLLASGNPELRTPRPVEVDLGGLAAVDISSGDAHMCAALETGRVLCWGSNADGQTGLSESITRVAVPTQPQSEPVDIVDVELGQDVSCATSSAGAVTCWGRSSTRQIPDATGVIGPTAVPLLADASAIRMGGNHGCALRPDGVLFCWGESNFGALGRGATADGPLSPAPVADLRPDHLDTGFRHTCASVGPTLYCWGEDGAGQVGQGAVLLQGTPTRVDLPGVPLAISAGEQSTCAVLDDGSVHCWGEASFGRLGNDSTVDRSAPVRVVTEFGSALTGASRVVVGVRNACATVGTATHCWGSADNQQLGEGLSEPLNGAAAVAVPSTWTTTLDLGDRFACWLTNSQQVGCVGRSSENILGRSCSTNFCGDYLPATDPPVTAATHLATGSNHVCAAAGTSLDCWGRDSSGQGLGATVLVDEVASLDTSTNTNCAALDNGTVYCWGANEDDYFFPDGLDAIRQPELVVGVTEAKVVAVGDQFACAVDDSGVTCWGNNGMGQLGRGVIGGPRAPQPVALPAGQVLELDAGHLHACAIVSPTDGDGEEVQCWGSDRFGRLGSGRELVVREPVELTASDSP